jgi:hypothetical protein
MAELAELRRVYDTFCSFGAPGATRMNNVKWAKFCRDQGILSRQFDKTAADLVFTRCVSHDRLTSNTSVTRDLAVCCRPSAAQLTALPHSFPCPIPRLACAGLLSSG